MWSVRPDSSGSYEYISLFAFNPLAINGRFRKLRRRGTNLLGGRAVTRNLDAFSYKELGDAFDVDFSLQWGFLPWVQLDRQNAHDILNAYVNTYIKEEIKEEGIVRSLPPFLRFLNIAGQLNGQLINGRNISREASVPRSSVDVYFSILEDTLLGHFLPAYRPKLKVREQAHPKFYWFDPGVARAAAGLLFDPVDRLWKGAALKNLIYHELRAYNLTQNRNRPISFYRTASGVEIDFLIETRKRQQISHAHIVCIEVKMAEKWDRKWERPMRSLYAHDGIHVDKMIGVYTGKRAYHFEGIDVLPVEDFLNLLHQGEIFWIIIIGLAPFLWMDDPRKKNLRLAIKGMALASSGKVLREEAIPSFVHVLHERPGWRYGEKGNKSQKKTWPVDRTMDFRFNVL